MQRILVISVFFLTTAFSGKGQSGIGEAEKKMVIDSVSSIMAASYLFPGTGIKMGQVITENFNRKEYDRYTDAIGFAAKLTEDLVAVSHDRHIRVFFDPDWVKQSRTAVTKQDSLAVLSRDLPRWKKENFGFKEVKILPGNIGYVNLTGMMDIKFGGETGVAAMNFLSNTDALIIDFRENHGGSDMGTLLASYLFDGNPVMLAELHLREGNKIIQEWTLAHVPGKRMPHTPVYILTSNFTFSAAEAIAQRLKVLKRAITIGERTGGGAHITDQKAATDRFCVFVPYGRSIGDPEKDIDWEGVGVIPDIAASAEDALTTAYITSLENLIKTGKDTTNTYQWHLDNAKAKQKPFDQNSNFKQKCTGLFGDISISMQNAELLYRKGMGAIYHLIPQSGDTFVVDELSYLRVRFNESDGKIVSLTRFYEDGSERTAARTE